MPSELQLILTGLRVLVRLNSYTLVSLLKNTLNRFSPSSPVVTASPALRCSSVSVKFNLDSYFNSEKIGSIWSPRVAHSPPINPQHAFEIALFRSHCCWMVDKIKPFQITSRYLFYCKFSNENIDASDLCCQTKKRTKILTCLSFVW